jgi:hypothetical protein
MANTSFVKQPARGPLTGLTKDSVNFSSSGDNTIIAAVPGRILKIHKLFIVGRATELRFWSGPSSEADPRSGLMPFDGNFGLAFDGDDFPMEMAIDKAFVISSSNAVQCGGWISYSVY